MLKKIKAFCKKHKVEILVIGGGVVVAVASVILGKKAIGHIPAASVATFGISGGPNSMSEDEARKYLEGIGAKIVGDACYATKDVATKFLDDRGTDYQLVLLSPTESAIFIQTKVDK